MPSTQELFGDGDLEAGKADLKPERSDNVNLSASYNKQLGKHGLYVEGGSFTVTPKTTSNVTCRP